MCMGYARETRAWFCSDLQNQRDDMMHAWSMAFEQSSDELGTPFRSLPLASNPDPAVPAQVPIALRRAAPDT